MYTESQISQAEGWWRLVEECSGQREQHNLKSPLFKGSVCIYVCSGEGERGTGSKNMDFVSYLCETWRVACLLQATSRSSQLKTGYDSTNEPSIQST